jgi:hypothetical protein
MKILTKAKLEEIKRNSRLEGQNHFINWLRGQTIYTKPLKIVGDHTRIDECTFLDGQQGIVNIGDGADISHCHMEGCSIGIDIKPNPVLKKK